MRPNFVVKTTEGEYYYITGALLALTWERFEVYDEMGDLEHEFPLTHIESVHPTTLSLKEWMELGYA